MAFASYNEMILNAVDNYSKKMKNIEMDMNTDEKMLNFAYNVLRSNRISEKRSKKVIHKLDHYNVRYNDHKSVYKNNKNDRMSGLTLLQAQYVLKHMSELIGYKVLDCHVKPPYNAKIINSNNKSSSKPWTLGNSNDGPVYMDADLGKDGNVNGELFHSKHPMAACEPGKFMDENGVHDIYNQKAKPKNQYDITKATLDLNHTKFIDGKVIAKDDEGREWVLK